PAQLLLFHGLELRHFRCLVLPRIEQNASESHVPVRCDFRGPCLSFVDQQQPAVAEPNYLSASPGQRCQLENLCPPRLDRLYQSVLPSPLQLSEPIHVLPGSPQRYAEAVCFDDSTAKRPAKRDTTAGFLRRAGGVCRPGRARHRQGCPERAECAIGS